MVPFCCRKRRFPVFSGIDSLTSSAYTSL